MKIGINGRFLAAKQTGVQRAAYNMLKSLINLDKNNQYVFFVPESQKDNTDWARENVLIITHKNNVNSPFKRLIWEQFSLPKLAYKHKIDLLHSPANTAPIFYKGKSIIHIHDLCFVVNPNWYSFTFRKFYSYILPILARRATKVITNSNNSRNDLLYYYKLNPKKVSKVYWAVDKQFFSNQTQNAEKSDYILYVGSLDPRKNIIRLITAFENYKDSHPKSNTKLLIIGAENHLFAHTNLNLKKYKDQIIFKGYVNDKDLRQYYKKAKLCIYPSLYEGFGFPPLEAMASGTPVLTSRTSSLPEVVGNAALMVDPLKIEEITEGIKELLNNPSLAASLVQKGYIQANKFSWKRVARNVLIIYYQIYNSEAPSPTEGRHISFDDWKSLRGSKK